MAPIPVHIKHAGKTHDVSLDVEQLPVVFKQSIYEVTGVPVDRMKVMIKGGVLKDDTPWKKVAPKEVSICALSGMAVVAGEIDHGCSAELRHSSLKVSLCRDKRLW